MSSSCQRHQQKEEIHESFDLEDLIVRTSQVRVSSWASLTPKIFSLCNLG
jgi:hypothetical protein